jgi:hypothetical protein
MSADEAFLPHLLSGIMVNPQPLRVERSVDARGILFRIKSSKADNAPAHRKGGADHRRSAPHHEALREGPHSINRPGNALLRRRWSSLNPWSFS